MKIKASRQDILHQCIGIDFFEISCDNFSDEYCEKKRCHNCPVQQYDYLTEEIEIEIPESWVE